MADGDDGTDEDLFRMDMPGNVQVQLFMPVRPLKRDATNRTAIHKCPRMFIEVDVRRGPNDDRVHYACDGWMITKREALELSQMNSGEVEFALLSKIDHVRSLDNDPEMCDREFVRQMENE